jgi:hypothetical protein
LIKDVDSGFWQALRLLLPNSGVESGVISIRKLLQQLMLCVRLAFNLIGDDVQASMASPKH